MTKSEERLRKAAANGAAVDDRPNINCVVVGDGGCGKTSMLVVYMEGEFPEVYTPTVFENYTTEVSAHKTKALLTIWDTAGQEDYDRLRPLSYDSADVVLICYDITNPTSFDNVDIRWFPEVKHFCARAPRILVGCKRDLIDADPRCSGSDRSSHSDDDDGGGVEDFVTTEMGEEMSRRIGAHSFVECSARKRINVERVFTIVADAALGDDDDVTSGPRRRQRQRQRAHGKSNKQRECCVIL